MQSVQLLLDVCQHGVHVPHTRVEGHLGFYHTGRADLFGRQECRRSGYQRRRKGPQPVHRQHRAQHHEHQRRRIVRQDTGLPGADDLAHGRSPFPGQVPLVVPIIQPFAKNASGFMKNLQLGNYLVIQSISAVPHTCRSISGRQAALAGLVLGSLTAARPVTGCRYFV